MYLDKKYFIGIGLIFICLVAIIVLKSNQTTVSNQLPEGNQITENTSEPLPPKAMMSVKLYYPSSELAREFGDPCSPETISNVERLIEKTNTPIKDTLTLLIKGDITDNERFQGLESEFPNKDFTLLDARLKNGVLTLKFTEVPGFTTGGACRVGILKNQIIFTAKQFPEVKEVVFEPPVFEP